MPDVEPQQQPQQQQQQQQGVPADWNLQPPGGLTDPYGRSDRPGQRKSSSPIKKFLSYFFGICKSQRDIQVAQQQQRIKDKKMRDQIKQIHWATGAQPPASPLTPEIPEVEIPSVEETMKQYKDAGIFD